MILSRQHHNIRSKYFIMLLRHSCNIININIDFDYDINQTTRLCYCQYEFIISNESAEGRVNSKQ